MTEPIRPPAAPAPAAPKPLGVYSIRVRHLGEGLYDVPGIGRVQGKDAAMQAAAQALAALRG